MNFSFQVWFTDQHSTLLEIEDKINITLLSYWFETYKKCRAIELNLEMEYFVKKWSFIFCLKKAKNIGKNISKILSKECNQKLNDQAKQSATDALKTTSKWAIQKTSETTGDVTDEPILI